MFAMHHGTGTYVLSSLSLRPQELCTNHLARGLLTTATLGSCSQDGLLLPDDDCCCFFSPCVCYLIILSFFFLLSFFPFSCLFIAHRSPVLRSVFLRVCAFHGICSCWQGCCCSCSPPPMSHESWPVYPRYSCRMCVA